ncbi:MAG: hypothetical protein ACRDST_12675 [Pseudonocardiaceae bacterium]
MRLVPARFLYHRTLSELTTRTSRYPELSLGDLVARAFHDWDNTHGLAVEGGDVVFGDGHLDEGVTKDLALAGVRAGTDDVEVAFGLGASGSALSGEALYERVREATGAGGDAFLAETRIPRLSPANPGQNWAANDAETLWESPMVGGTGTTVGEALVAMLEPGELFMRQLDGLGSLRRTWRLCGAHPRQVAPRERLPGLPRRIRRVTGPRPAASDSGSAPRRWLRTTRRIEFSPVGTRVGSPAAPEAQELMDKIHEGRPVGQRRIGSQWCGVDDRKLPTSLGTPVPDDRVAAAGPAAPPWHQHRVGRPRFSSAGVAV